MKRKRNAATSEECDFRQGAKQRERANERNAGRTESAAGNGHGSASATRVVAGHDAANSFYTGHGAVK